MKSKHVYIGTDTFKEVTSGAQELFQTAGDAQLAEDFVECSRCDVFGMPGDRRLLPSCRAVDIVIPAMPDELKAYHVA